MPLLDGDGDASGDGEGDSVTLSLGIASFAVFSMVFRGDESNTTWMEGSIPGSATGAGKGVSTTTDEVVFSTDTVDSDVTGDRAREGDVGGYTLDLAGKPFQESNRPP